MHINWKEIKWVSIEARLAKGYLHSKDHVKLRRNTSVSKQMQQEKVLVFSLIKENTISKALGITLALTTQKPSDFLIWTPQMLSSENHNFTPALIFLHYLFALYWPKCREKRCKDLLSLPACTQWPRINVVPQIIHT